MIMPLNMSAFSRFSSTQGTRLQVTAQTRQSILISLSHGPQTILELSQSLSLTRNAIVVQLQQLTAEGLVRRGRLRRTSGAGKPGYEYEIVPGTEDAGSKAYRPLVGQILAAMQRRLSPAEIAEILDEAGRGLAREAEFEENGEPMKRLERAVAIVNSLGACAEITKADGNSLVVENRRCPFASAVRIDKCVCRAAAAFFREATGQPFEQRCETQGMPRCRYVAVLGKGR